MGILEIIELAMAATPKIIAGGKMVADLWHLVAGAISGAEANGGVVDPATEAKIKAMLDAQLAVADQNATEAKAP